MSSPRDSLTVTEVDEQAVVQTLALQGWRSESLENIFRSEGPIRPAPISSPLSQQEIPEAGLVNDGFGKDASAWWIWKAFHQEREYFKKFIISQWKKASEDEETSCLGVLETLAQTATPESNVNPDPAGRKAFPEIHMWPRGKLRYQLNLGFPLTAVPTPESTMQKMMADGMLDIICLRDGHGALGFFVINRGPCTLVINSQFFGSTPVVVGPLPGFAVIEFDRVTMFWWHMRPSLDYVAKEERNLGNTRSLDAEEDFAGSGRSNKRQRMGGETHGSAAETSNGVNESSPSRPPGPSPPSSLTNTTPRSWEWRLNEGLARYRQRLSRKGLSRHGWRYQLHGNTCTQISSFEAMEHTEVVHAIGCMWRGLSLENIMHSYADIDVFTHAAEFSWVAGRPNKFIIPMHVRSVRSQAPPRRPTTKRAKKGVSKGKVKKTDEEVEVKVEGAERKLEEAKIHGHFLLAVAELAPIEEGKRSRKQKKVIVHVYDSLGDEPFMKTRVKAEVERVISQSGWLGVDSAGHPQEIDISPIHPQYPSVPTQEGLNTCGLYTILNAWAVMLGIEFHGGKELEGFADSDRFHTQALEIINLALAGYMDSETIQAFMNVYGYCKAQDPSDDTQAAHQARTIWMNGDRLRDILTQQGLLDAWEWNGRPDPPKDVLRDLQEICSFATREEIIQAYVQGGQNQAEASNRLLSMEALSKSSKSSIS